MPSAGIISHNGGMRAKLYIILTLGAVVFLLLYVTTFRQRTYDDIDYDYSVESNPSKKLRFSDEVFDSDYLFYSLEAVLKTKDGQEEAGKLAVLITVQVNSGNHTKIWVLDTKSEKKAVYITKNPGSVIPDCQVEVSDEDCVKMAKGKLNVQSAFLSGQLKVFGNVLKAAKLKDLFYMGMLHNHQRRLDAFKKLAARKDDDDDASDGQQDQGI